MSDFINDISVPLPPEPPIPRLLLGQKRPRRPSMGGRGQGPTQPLQAQTPIGSVIAYAGVVSSDPTQPSSTDNDRHDHPNPLKHITDPEPMGWLVCDGRALYIAQYPELFGAIGFLYGEGDKTGTFKIPDYRGYFLRGVDDGKYGSEDKARDPDRGARTAAPGGINLEPGSTQEDAVQVHEHMYKVAPATAEPAKPPPPPPVVANLAQPPATEITENGLQDSKKPGTKPVKQSLTETRPKNTYVYFLIKCF